MYTVNTSSEAVADSSANETHLDIEALFRAHFVEGRFLGDAVATQISRMLCSRRSTLLHGT